MAPKPKSWQPIVPGTTDDEKLERVCHCERCLVDGPRGQRVVCTRNRRRRATARGVRPSGRQTDA